MGGIGAGNPSTGRAAPLVPIAVFATNIYFCGTCRGEAGGNTAPPLPQGEVNE